MTPITAALLGAVGGALLGALLVWFTVRDRPAQHEQAMAANTQLYAVVEALRAVVVVVDGTGSVVVSSPFARGCGLVRGTRLTAPKVAAAAAEVTATGEGRALGAEISRGAAIPPAVLELSLAALPDGAVLVTGEDRSADQRFSETRRDFVANITHELKTPIGAVALLAEAMEAAADDPAAIRQFTGRLGAEAQRLNDLVSQIIALSRLQSEDPMLAAEPVDLDVVVASTLQRCRPLAERAEVALTASGEPGLTVLGDAGQLEAAVTNLVQNAIAYSEPGAKVTVTTRRPAPDEVELRVSDTGIGISEADLERVFERFYRVDYGRSRAHGGTGLGLSIVKHVVAAHGGEVEAWSRLGSGSTFTLRFPEYIPEGGRR